LGLIAVVCCVCHRILNADECNLWKFHLKGNVRNRLRQIQAAYDRQGSVIGTAWTLFFDLSTLFNEWPGLSNDVRRDRLRRRIEFVLSAVPGCVDHNGQLRVCILALREGMLCIQHHTGYDESTVKKLALYPDSRSCAGTCFETKKEYYCKDVTQDKHFQAFDGSQLKYKSIYCAPIISGDTILGVLSIDSVIDIYRCSDADAKYSALC